MTSIFVTLAWVFLLFLIAHASQTTTETALMLVWVGLVVSILFELLRFLGALA